MANNKKVKRGFHELLSNAQTTVTRVTRMSTTTTAIRENSITSHIEVHNKIRSHCNMKYKNRRTTRNNNCCSNQANSINSRTNRNSSIRGNCSCSQSLSLCHFSSYSPNSIITFITTTIYSGMQNVNNLLWRYLQQWQQQKLQQHQQQQQYKIKQKTSKYLSSASSTSTATTSSLKNRNIFTSLKLYFFVWLFLSLLAPCISLTMTEVRIPKHIMRHETAALGCKYDLDGESLYSVKWYKDGFEFYRYVPRDMPPGQVFPLPGVDVELQNSTDNVVVLNRVTLQSTGRYRCEVSGEAPSFQTVSGHEDMIVVVTPLKGPQITGGQPRYSIGEKVFVNCTSAPSKPICHLSWLINGVHANRSYLRYYEPKIVGREGLEVATLGLEFRVRG